MTTTTASARTRPAPATDDDDEADDAVVDEFESGLQAKATRWLQAQAQPKDGKETKTTAAARFVKEFFDRFGWSAFEHVRGETAAALGEIDVLTERVNQIDPPDFEEYLNKVLGFTVGADAYFKYVTGRMKEELDKAGVTGVFDDKGGFIQDADLKHTASFAMILGEVHKETAEIIAEEYGPDDVVDGDGGDDDSGEDDESGEGEPAEEDKPAA